jgi:hypothetical protein
MHKHVTHNRCHKTLADFKAAILIFLREEVPRNWDIYCDQITDIPHHLAYLAYLA